MGTERSIEHQEPCLCEQGSYVIEYCLPDHGWPGSERGWYESRIECTECSALYEIKQLDQKFFLIEKKHLRELEERKHEVYARHEALMQTDTVIQLLNQLEQLLKSQSSVAATFRLLSHAKLIMHCTERTFCNHWRNPQEWIKDSIRAESLPKVLTLLNLSYPSVVEELAEIKAFRKSRVIQTTSVASPIYVLP